jgi:hypothetical protein
MIALLIETVTAYIALVSLSVFNHDSAAMVPLLVWLVLSAAAYGANCLMHRITAKIIPLWIGNVVLYAIMTAVLYRMRTGFSGATDTIALFALCAVIIYRARYFVWHPTNGKTKMAHFEMAFLQTAWILLLMEGEYGILLTAFVCIVAAPIAGMADLSLYRSGKRLRESAGLMVLAILFGFVSAVAVLLQHAVQQAASAAASAGGYILNGAWNLFERFGYWLASIIPGMEIGTIELEDETSALNQIADASVSLDEGRMRIVGIVVLAVLVVCVVVFLIYLAGKLKNVSEEEIEVTKRTRMIRGNETHFWYQLYLAAAYRQKAWKNRHNALGAYLWLERFGKRHGKPKSGAMTVREYIQTFEKEGDEGLSRLLNELAECLERYFYMGKDSRQECLDFDVEALKKMLETN